MHLKIFVVVINKRKNSTFAGIGSVVIFKLDKSDFGLAIVLIRNLGELVLDQLRCIGADFGNKFFNVVFCHVIAQPSDEEFSLLIFLV